MIAGRPPTARLSPPPKVWVTVTERGLEVNASADVGDVTLGFGPVAEMLTAAHVVLVALAGFYSSRRTGRSIVASIAMSEVTATCVTSLLLPSLCERPAPPRQTAKARTVILQCSNGAVSVTLNNQDRIDLAEMTGVASLVDTSPESFKSMLQSWSRELTRDEVVRIRPELEAPDTSSNAT